MKKKIFFLLGLIGLLSFTLAQGEENQNADRSPIKEFKISMDRDGQIAEIVWNQSIIYTPPSPPGQITPPDPFVVRLPDGKAFPKALSVGTQVTIAISGINKTDLFKIVVSLQKSKYELIPIFTGETKPLFGANDRTKPPEQTSSFILDESGTTYKIEVTRSTNGQPPASEKAIFSESLQTRARYNLGSHVGVFFPFSESTDYSLGYVSPDDVNATIRDNSLRNVTMIFVGSIYPFGFEPEDEVFSYRRIQLNLATELSGSIFKKIYFGLGYDFTYFSICVLGRFGAVQELQSGFSVGDQVSTSIKTVPTVSKNRLNWGVTVCLPLNLMMGWLGRSLGLK